MEPDRVEQYLERVLHVCRQLSEYGNNRYGIFYLSSENKNILDCLFQHTAIIEVYPWVLGVIEGHDIFFGNIINALSPTYPGVGRYPDGETYPYEYYHCNLPGRDYKLAKFEESDPHDKEACLSRVIKVCRSELFTRLDWNRQLIGQMEKYPDVFRWISWSSHHLMSNDIFFMNLYRALEGLIKEIEKDSDYPRPWPGFKGKPEFDDYSEILFRFAPLPV